MIIDDQILNILNKFPFLTYGRYLDTFYLGIVNNADTTLISMYVITDIQTSEMRDYFLKLGDEYWWNSSRNLPINIFIKDRFRPFRECLKHFSRKEFEIVAGNMEIVSLQDIVSKRIRKRQVTLVKPAIDK